MTRKTPAVGDPPSKPPSSTRIWEPGGVVSFGHAHALQLAVSGASLQQVLEVLAQTAELQAGSGAMASVLLMDDDGKRLRHGAAPSLPEEYIRAVDGLVIGPEVGSCGACAYTGKPVVSSDIANDPKWADFRVPALTHGLRACWSTPILSSQGRVLGAFALYYPAPCDPSPQDHLTVELLTHTAALVIERDRELKERLVAQQRLLESEARLAADAEALANLHEFSSLLLLAPDVQSVFEQILAATLRLLGADMGAVQVYDAERKRLEFVAQRGFPKSYLIHFSRAQDDGAACGRARRSGERVIIHDVTTDEAYEPHRAVAAEAGYRAVIATPLKSRSGALLGVLSTHFKRPHRPSRRELRMLDLYVRQACDFVERVRIEERLRESEWRLQESDRRKDEFLAMLGHELRNPLAGIVSGAEALRAIDLPEDGAEMRAIISRQAAHMSHILSDLLDVSRIVRGKLTLRRRPLDLRQLVHDAVEDYRRANRIDDCEIRRALPKEQVWVKGDFTRLSQVLTNLVHNSVKFSDGPNVIDVRLTAEPDGKSAKLSVRDQGIGMTPEMTARVFESFSQADTSVERGRGGLGLGLALVKGLVELHGGEVNAWSDGPGEGAQFVVTLPTCAPGREEREEEAVTTAPPREILLIDDRRDAIFPVKRLLEKQGHRVQTAEDGAAGLAAAAATRPDVILCDISLGEKMNGYDVARAVRRTPELAGAYLVALSGYGLEDDRRQAREAGFDYHLTKPVGFDDLQDLLTRTPRFSD